jgi:hypothetical protein
LTKQLGGISSHDRRWIAVTLDPAISDPHGATAELLYCRHAVGYQDDCSSSLSYLTQPLKAFPLKALIPNRQNFVDYQNVRVHADRHGKP